MSGDEAEWRENAREWMERDDYDEIRETFEEAFRRASEEFEAEEGAVEDVLEFVAPCLSACDLLAIYGLESSFGTNPAACPPDGKFGASPWCGFQFDRETAREYGLTVDEARGVDEREDRTKAARAAASYLLALGRLLTWRRFSSLGVEGELSDACLEGCRNADCEELRKLVYASYNAGPATVARARIQAGDDCCDWETVRQHLPAEARTYGDRGHTFRDVFCPPADGDDGDGGAGEDGGDDGDGGGSDAGGGSDGGGSDDRCFIATAAYGTPAATEIDVLRAFRDDVLERHASGRVFVRAYYRASPPVASWIARTDRRRRIVRRFLVEPAVRAVRYIR